MLRASLGSVLKIFKRGHKTKSNMIVFPCVMKLSPNGLRTIKEETGRTLESIVLLIEAGPRFEIECNHGVTYFLEHMFYKGLKTMSKETFSKTLEDLEIRMWSRTARALQELTFHAPTKSVPQLLSLLYDIFNDKLKPTDVTIEETKKAVFEQLGDHEKNLRSLTMDYAHQAAYCGTPLSKPVIGPVRNISLFDPDFLKSYLSYRYLPSRMVISASGPLPSSEFVDIVAQTLANLPARCPCLEDCMNRFSGAHVLYRDDDIPHTHCVLAVEAYGYNTHQYIELRLLKHVVGSYIPSIGGGIKAWPITAQGADLANICVEYETFYYYYHDTGLWGVYFASDVMSTDNMVTWILNHFQHLCHSLSDSDLERAKNCLKMEICKEFCSGMSSARTSAVEFLYTCKRRNIEQWLSEIDKIDREAMRALAYDIFYDKELVVAGVGRTGLIYPISRLRNSMYWLRY